MKTVIIGSGNVATVLARKIALAGHELVEVNSREEQHAKKLADEIGCRYSSGWDSINRGGDFYLIAISDHMLSEIEEKISLQEKLVVHTAGSVSKEVLKNVSARYGILYPLQTLRKEIKELPEIPLLVDGNTPEDLGLIFDFAKSLSVQVQVMDDDHRSRIHLASVLVNNFSNHLYALAEQYCIRENLDFSLLLPLILETAKRVTKFSPSLVQTGPAMRGDQSTLEKQLFLLNDDPALKKIYELFTKSIQNYSSGL
jgi:predicted short-subunit dehydrogenase-like oxidoreductase (DUF2520 family)